MHIMLRRNLGIKIVSFLFAILFWLFVMNQNSPDALTGNQTLTIPLVANGVPQNMVLMTKLPSVRVRVQAINPSVNINDLYAVVNLSGGTAGDHDYPVSVNSPPGMTVLDKQPTSVNLKLDIVQEKTVTVAALVTGNPAEGYQVGTPIVKPSAVNVRGPSSLLSTLNKVTAEVSVAGANNTVEVSRPISFLDKEGKPIFGPDPSRDILSAYPSSVDVIVPVMAKSLASKMIPIKVTSSGTPAAGKVLRSLIASPAGALVLGSSKALDGIDSLTIGPVDISDLSQDKTFPIPLDKVNLPQGVSFMEGTTLSVIAQIGPGTTQKTISGVTVQIRNIGTGLEVDQAAPPTDIVVEGLPDILNSLTPDQIQLWVDAAGQGAGKYTDIKAYWQLPSGVTMISTPQVNYSLKAKAP